MGGQHTNSAAAGTYHEAATMLASAGIARKKKMSTYTSLSNIQ